MINRRVAVENVLFSVASGKRPMLSREECRELANKLGSAAERKAIKAGQEEFIRRQGAKQ